MKSFPVYKASHFDRSMHNPLEFDNALQMTLKHMPILRQTDRQARTEREIALLQCPTIDIRRLVGV